MIKEMSADERQQLINQGVKNPDRRLFGRRLAEGAAAAPVIAGAINVERVFAQESDAKPIDSLLFDPEQFQDGDKIETAQMPQEMREHLLMPKHTIEHVITLIEAALKLEGDVSIHVDFDFAHILGPNPNDIFAGTFSADITPQGGTLNIEDDLAWSAGAINEQTLAYGLFNFSSKQEAVDIIIGELKKRVTAGDQILEHKLDGLDTSHSIDIERYSPDGTRQNTSLFLRKTIDTPVSGITRLRVDGIKTIKVKSGQPLQVVEISASRFNDLQVAIQGAKLSSDTDGQTVKTGDLIGKMEDVQQS